MDISSENHSSQKEVAQYFSSANRKELTTQNPTPSKNIIQEWRKSQEVF